MICSKCNIPVQRKDENISCTKCTRSYHLTCTDLETPQTPAEKKKWACAICTTNPSSTPKTASAGTGTGSNTPKTDDPGDKTSLREINNKLTWLINQQNETSTKLNTLIEDNKKMKKLLSDKDQIIIKLEKRVVALEQRTRINNIEISNYPENPNENIRDIVKMICAKMEVQITDADIQATHRVPRFNKGIKNIVVNFSSRWTKNKVLMATKDFRKVKKRQLLASDVSQDLPADTFYVSEHLCPEMKQLLKKTKIFARANNYQYVWVKDGVINLKKNAEARNVFAIGSDLDFPQPS
uniref:PHD-type domain-containing protein n=1 Tax=Cacopsylla melanoneura TaxID=428564 RepID=A0A8D9EWT0_9HEMI